MSFIVNTYTSLVSFVSGLFGANKNSNQANEISPQNMGENMRDKARGEDAGQAIPLNIPPAKKSIGDWAKALQQASSNKPNLIPLYGVYENAELDLQYSAAKLKRVMRLQQTPIKAVKANGEKDEQATKYFSKKFVRSLARHYVDTIFWGHSLGYIYAIPDDFEIVPRTNVFPDKKWFKINYTDPDEKAIPYNTDQAKRLFFEIKSDENLGWLKKIAPIILYKRYANARWSAYIEQYGDLFRTAKMNGADKAREKVLGEILKNMGANGYAVIRSTEELKIEKMDMGSPELFFVLMNYCDEQITKAVLTATMTMDNGSSRSQGEVHQTETDIIFAADRVEFLSIINNQVLPMLQVFGIMPQGIEIVQDDKREYTTQERIDIVNTLIGDYEISADYVADIFDIPTDKIKPKAAASTKVTNQAPKLQAVAEPHVHTLINMNDEELKKLFNDAANWDSSEFNVTNKELTEAITSGWGAENLTLDYDAPDHLTRALFLADIHRFGYERTAAQVFELNKIAKTTQTLNEFLTQAKSYLNGKTTHLETEYNTAKAIAQSTSRMIEYMRDKEDFPYVKYVTVGDARVRDEHAALNGKVFDLRKGTPVPLPSGWGCRCVYVRLADYEGELTTREQGIEILKGTMKNPDNLEKGGWLVDRLDTKQVFDDKLKYLGGLTGAPTVLSLNEVSYAEQGRKDAENIMQGKTATLDTAIDLEKQKDAFQAAKDEKGYVINENIHLQPVFTDEVDFNLLVNQSNVAAWANVKKALRNPDEVYYQYNEDTQTHTYIYVKFYNNAYLHYELVLRKDLPLQISTIKVGKDATIVDKLRKGVLVYGR
jgi:SPP1 gp7 family putative phage head morphogenesis protein